jgi:transcriptional regulator with XRE-family HTH domain
MAETAEAAARRLELGRRVRRRRMALGWTQVKLAEQMHIPQGVVSRIEKGAYRAMNVTLLAELADALHTTSDYLLSRTDEPGEVPFLEECLAVV